jgi:hypothetical protein
VEFPLAEFLRQPRNFRVKEIGEPARGDGSGSDPRAPSNRRQVVSRPLAGVRNSWAKKPGKTDTTRERYLRAESRCGPADRGGLSGSGYRKCPYLRGRVHTYVHSGINSTVADVADVENVLSRILSEVFRV